MKEYLVPALFFDDHVDRDLPPANRIWENGLDSVVVGASKSFYRVMLTDDEVSELLSDAVYHSESVGDLGSGYRGLVASAKATVSRLRKQVTA